MAEITPKQKPYTEEKFKQDADKFIKGYLGGFDQGEMNNLLKRSVSKIENAGVMSSDEAKDFIKERASYLKDFIKDNPGETLPQLKEESKKTGDPFLDKLMFLPNTLDKVAEKIAPMLGYADGGRIGFLEGGDTKYNAMVTKMYIEAGGQKGTGMDIDTFAEKYFPKMAQGGRVNYNEGSMDPDTMALKEKIEEIMDIEGVGFGEAFKQAMRELASQSREKNSEGTMPKSERWMRDYFFSGKGGYDDRMTYKEFALGPGQELYKRFSKD